MITLLHYTLLSIKQL